MMCLTIIFFSCYSIMFAQLPVNKQNFDLLNLSYAGLKNVDEAIKKENYTEAAKQLLSYYRQRKTAQIASQTPKNANNNVQQLADDILQHKFKPHKGYPAFDYGKDINWQYRPVKDQLLTTFLHRTTFWESLGTVYLATGDEKYAKEWIFEVQDWIKKNKQGAYADDKDFAWKAFVVSFRLNNWASFFNTFINSPNFTPQFLMDFLASYHQQANYVMANYTDIGNHRLYEAEHLLLAGTSFPELAKADVWRKSGITVLNEEISKQVYADGVQFELSPSYHIGTIGTFLRALKMAKDAGIEKEFPQGYRNLVEKMITAVPKFSFPDYTFPLYGNSFLTTKAAMLKNYQEWSNIFPQNKVIEYFATDGASGKPDFRCSSLPNAGFYAFRSGLNNDATVMQIKAGPPAEFHSHPDNGNFELWVKGRNFTPDAGSFVYANVGDQANAKRDWYRSTKAHQTLTIDDKNIENNSKVSKWEIGSNLDILSYTNPSYKNLNHQRTFLFIDKTFFIIIDRAMGTATGNLGIHYHFKEDSKATLSITNHNISTHYADGNNLLIQVLNKDKVSIKEEPSFVSYQYQKETARPAYVFEKAKPDEKNQGYISLVYPYNGNIPPSVKITENSGNNIANGAIDITLNINGKTTLIKQDLSK